MSADRLSLSSLSPSSSSSSSFSSLVTTVCAATCAAAAVVVAASSVVIAANSVTNAPLPPSSTFSSAKCISGSRSSRSRIGASEKTQRTALAPGQLLLECILPRFLSGRPPSRIQQVRKSGGGAEWTNSARRISNVTAIN